MVKDCHLPSVFLERTQERIMQLWLLSDSIFTTKILSVDRHKATVQDNQNNSKGKLGWPILHYSIALNKKKLHFARFRLFLDESDFILYFVSFWKASVSQNSLQLESWFVTSYFIYLRFLRNTLLHLLGTYMLFLSVLFLFVLLFRTLHLVTESYIKLRRIPVLKVLLFCTSAS
jgi:hypothetical protein